jgi:hypothetical protein
VKEAVVELIVGEGDKHFIECVSTPNPHSYPTEIELLNVSKHDRLFVDIVDFIGLTNEITTPHNGLVAGFEFPGKP